MEDSSESVEGVYLRLRTIVVERITLVEFRVDNRGSDGTGFVRIKLIMEFMNIRIARLRK